MSAPRSLTPSSHAPTRTRAVQPYEHDTYKMRRKLRDLTVCPECGAVFHKGRWTWRNRPAEAHVATCPACHRTRDKYPAGVVTLSGAFLVKHRREILGVARNAEKQEKAEHPLSRIMSIEEQGTAVMISTTDTHLARRIGEALHHAYEGDFKLKYSKSQQLVRVSWKREF